MKRLVASVLWFFSCWYAGSMVATLFGLPDFGPVLGIAAGLLVGIDPRHVIWTRTPRSQPMAATAGASAPTAA